ncbi:MAG: UDP-N-acetylglucosamine 1-carboxyvinyltransferase [Limnochordales bacterium]|nr:UDP-N-acetylglucosamine 1-carboxyvinyltransferase [Limnochordales bacterium]
MEAIWIQGGNQLAGNIAIYGAKNSALKLMAAALLTDQPCRLDNVPDIRDVRLMVQILEGMGVQVRREGESLLIEAKELGTEVPPEPVREMRAGIQVMGPVVARKGRIRIFQPGGCSLGPRPIDFHLRGLEAMGARVREEHGFIVVEAERLRGTDIYLDFPSVGATENLMMAAVLAEGTTVIHNAAREPEIGDAEKFLNQCGARVSGAGTGVIRVEGVTSLQGTSYQVMPDRIEAATFLIAAAAAGADLTLRPAPVVHLEAVLAKLSQIGVDWESPDPMTLRVRSQGALAEGYRPVHVRALPYPGFPTDVQPQITALLTLARGTSIVTDEVHAARFGYAGELRRMGAQIWVEGRTAVIKGCSHLTGARVTAPDLRGGAALIVAALAAEGESLIEGVVHLDRGYARLEERLRQVGARICRLEV